MKYIYIFSDTHRRINGCIDVLRKTQRVDAVIHAGDHDSDAQDIANIFPQLQVFYVRGNCDSFSTTPCDMNIIIAGKKIFVTHGHMYNVKTDYSLDMIKNKAKVCDADLVIFGHTHRPLVEYNGKMIIVNPGSAGYGNTYAVAQIDGEKINVKTMNMD